jgi:hypothetical protein
MVKNRLFPIKSCLLKFRISFWQIKAYSKSLNFSTDCLDLLLKPSDEKSLNHGREDDELIYRDKLFEPKNDFNWKVWTTKLTRRKLQVSYKVYLHSSLYKKVTIFWKQANPNCHGSWRFGSTVMNHGGGLVVG